MSIVHTVYDNLKKILSLKHLLEPQQIVKEVLLITCALIYSDKHSSDNKTARLAFVKYLMSVTVVSCRSVCG